MPCLWSTFTNVTEKNKSRNWLDFNVGYSTGLIHTLGPTYTPYLTVLSLIHTLGPAYTPYLTVLSLTHTLGPAYTLPHCIESHPYTGPDLYPLPHCIESHPYTGPGLPSTSLYWASSIHWARPIPLPRCIESYTQFTVLQCVSKTGPLRLIWHNFTNS